MRRTVKTGFWIGFLRVRLLRVFTVEVAIIFWTSDLVAIVYVLRTANESDESRQLTLLNAGGSAKRSHDGYSKVSGTIHIYTSDQVNIESWTTSVYHHRV